MMSLKQSFYFAADLCSLYLIYKHLQDEGGDASIDPDEEVDGG